jgi:hypothetical protein
VAGCGAGLRLRPRASARAIARALGSLLGEPGYREAAARMAFAIAADREQDLAVAEIEALVAGRVAA